MRVVKVHYALLYCSLRFAAIVGTEELVANGPYKSKLMVLDIVAPTTQLNPGFLHSIFTLEGKEQSCTKGLLLMRAQQTAFVLTNDIVRCRMKHGSHGCD